MYDCTREVMQARPEESGSGELQHRIKADHHRASEMRFLSLWYDY